MALWYNKNVLKRKILVVDDDHAIRTLIRGVFEHEGYSVLEAQDGEEGFAVARNQNPSVVLLDVMMPRMDGFSICKQLKDSPITRHIPLIFVTVKEQVEARLEGFRVGADDYITKPFSPLELVARVEAVIHRASHLLDPVTGFPSRGQVEEEVFKALDGKRPFSILAFRLESWDKLVEACKDDQLKQVVVDVADILIKILSRQGDSQDFLGQFDRRTFVMLSFGLKPHELFDQVQATWQKLVPILERKLQTSGVIRLNGTHLRIENLNQNLDTIFKKINGLFEYAEKNKSYVSGTTLS